MKRFWLASRITLTAYAHIQPHRLHTMFFSFIIIQCYTLDSVQYTTYHITEVYGVRCSIVWVLSQSTHYRTLFIDRYQISSLINSNRMRNRKKKKKMKKCKRWNFLYLWTKKKKETFSTLNLTLSALGFQRLSCFIIFVVQYDIRCTCMNQHTHTTPYIVYTMLDLFRINLFIAFSV